MEDKSILDILPQEVVTNHIIAGAAASSSDSLFNLKKSCKTLREVSDDPCILQRVSLQKFNPVPWKPEEITFTERCTNAENPEALYRTGMMQCFGKEERESGMQYLQTAMDMGHLGAKYATGIILILQGGVQKLNGMQIILSLKKSCPITIFKQIRQNFLEMIKGMWITSTMIVGQEMPQCCTKHTTYSAGWEQSEDADIECENCSCHQELVHLWRVLPDDHI